MKKIKKYHYGIISSQNSLEMPRKKEIKNYRFVPFLPNALQNISKKKQKNSKNKKNTIMASFQARIG